MKKQTIWTLAGLLAIGALVAGGCAEEEVDAGAVEEVEGADGPTNSLSLLPPTEASRRA